MSGDFRVPSTDAGLVRAMQQYYDRRAGEYDEWYLRAGPFESAEDQQLWNDELAGVRAFLEAVKGNRVLEVACGTGYWTRYLATGRRLVGLDFSPEMLVRAQARTDIGSADLCRGDAYRLPFATGSFDAVVFAFWISHVPLGRLDAFLDEVHRVVRPGGQVACVDGMRPTSNREPETVDAERRVQGRRLRDGTEHSVVKVYYDEPTLRKCLTSRAEALEIATTKRFFIMARYRVRDPAR